MFSDYLKIPKINLPFIKKHNLSRIIQEKQGTKSYIGTYNFILLYKFENYMTRKLALMFNPLKCI